MKRTLPILLCVVFLTLLSACGDSESESGNNEEPQCGTECADVGQEGDTSETPDVAEDTAPQPDAPTGSCEPTPDPPETGICETWTCDEAPYPECWACEVIDAPAGAYCESAAGNAGQCEGRTCVESPLNRTPDQSGSFIGTTSQASATLADGGELPLTVYHPNQGENYPVVVLVHGFQLPPSLYASYGERLASWGYVVVMPQLPGELFNSPSHREHKESLKGLLDWLDAQSQSASEGFAAQMDTSNTSFIGHSMGGKLAMLLASEDARVRRIFAIDPVDGAGPLDTDPVEYPSVAPELMGQIQIPIVSLGETTNGTCEGAFCQACAPLEENFQQYYAATNSPAMQIDMLGANHVSFLDDSDCGTTCAICPAGTDDVIFTRQLTQKYMVAFFETSVRGDERHRPYLVGPEMDQDVSRGYVTVTSKNGF